MAKVLMLRGRSICIVIIIMMYAALMITFLGLKIVWKWLVTVLSEENVNKSDGRKRCWTFIVYPDDSNCNVVNCIRDMHVAACLSPLHSPVNDNGDEMKKHYHVMLSFNGKKSLSQVNDIVVGLRLNGLACTNPFPVTDKNALIAYFVHDGYPDKEQFKYTDLILLSGFKLNGLADTDSIVWDIIDWCNTAGVFDWAQLVDYARVFMPEWRLVLFSSKSYAIMAYLNNSKHLLSTAHIVKESEVNE